jgi:hypothetical protein
MIKRQIISSAHVLCIVEGNLSGSLLKVDEKYGNPTVLILQISIP